MPACQRECSVDMIRIYVLVNCICKFMYLSVNIHVHIMFVLAPIKRGLIDSRCISNGGGSEYFFLIFSTSDNGRVCTKVYDLSCSDLSYLSETICPTGLDHELISTSLCN